MNVYLIDYENVRVDGLKDLKGLNKGDALVIFYSEICKSISLEVLDAISELELKYSGFKVNVGKKDALDFQLVSYLGYLIGKGQSEDEYYIVSNDKGFKSAADFWKSRNVKVDCISPKEQAELEKAQKNKEAIKKEEKKSKVESNNLATLDEIKALVGKKGEVEEILKIFNQYKTKLAISNGLNKLFKDSKKTSEVYKKLKPLLKSKNKK